MRFGLFFVGVVMGATMMWLSLKEQAPVPREDAKGCQLEQIKKEDLESYLQETDPQKKLAKADELLGKVLQLFMVDLGFRISQKENLALTKASEQACAPTTTAAPTAAIDTQPVAAPKVNPTKIEASTPSGLRKPVFKVNFTNVARESDLKKIVEKSSPQNFGEVLSSLTPLSKETIQSLNGVFSGPMQRYDNGKTWSVQINVRTRTGETGFQQVLIRDENNKTVSNMRGNGTFSKNNFSYNDAIIIESGGAYLQLYYIEQFDMLTGQYFDNESPTKYTAVGYFELHRER